MGYWDAIVSDIKPSLTDWLSVRGGNVSDLPLHLINRSIEKICLYRLWDFLLKTEELTVSSLQATLPTDLGRILEVYHDSDSDGKPDWHYYRNDERVDKRYTITDTFSRTAGHAWTMTFATTPAYTPVLKYQAVLTAVTLDAHYLFFPAELVLVGAMLIHARAKNLKASDITALQEEYNRLMTDFEQVCQHSNNAMDTNLKDSQGDRIQTESYNLDGSVGRFVSSHDRSYDEGQ